MKILLHILRLICAHTYLCVCRQRKQKQIFSYKQIFTYSCAFVHGERLSGEWGERETETHTSAHTHTHLVRFIRTCVYTHIYVPRYVHTPISIYILPIWLMPTHQGMTVWPSGLRRWLKAPFRKGVGSKPTAANAAASERAHNIMAPVKAF